jgi:hypothetical protein
MKTNRFLCVAAALLGSLLAAMALGGCVSSKAFVWDEGLSEGETATVNVIAAQSFGSNYGIWVKSYNDIPVVGRYGSFKIPAGDAEFVADIVWASNSDKTTGKDLFFSYRFEGGKEYTLIAAYSGARGTDPAISIYSGGHSGLSMPPKANLLDEIVFERQQHVMTAGSN